MQKLQQQQRMKDRAEEHRYTLDNIVLRARLEREKNREIIEDKKKGELARIDSESRVKSASNKTDLAKDMLTSKSGIDRMKAVSKFQGEEEFNRVNTAMQRRHKTEMEALLDRGATESERMALEDRQKEESAKVQNSKSMADAIRESLGDMGSVRGLMGQNVGQTSSIQDVWKKAQQSAFGHVKDPVADAVTNMSKEASLFHANLMTCLVQYLPQLMNISQNQQMGAMQSITNYYDDGGLA